ncbi:zf-HC2 domain-containing protein [candidate division WOR-3 bacterium]|nr:zf-HC2 domain-containing protein [candidate division WOR-3 bacterium]
MKCIDKEKWLKYLKGEIDKTQREEIRGHIRECEKCRKMASQLTAAFESLDDLDGLNADPQFTTRLIGMIRKTHQVKPWERFLLPAVAATAALLSIFLGIFLGQNLYAVMQEEPNQANEAIESYYYQSGPVEYYIQEEQL